MNYSELSQKVASFLVEEMRDWLTEIFPDEEDEIRLATDETVIRVVDRTYDGGIAAFAIASLDVVIASSNHLSTAIAEQKAELN